MAIEIVRIPSETPNISNIDDFIGLRYAYGNQNGYVIDKGNECSYSINGSIFKINSGRIVLQGVECDIDANGVEINIDNVATTRYYTIYLQVNLSLNNVSILASYDTSTYPNVGNGDDLTENSTGIARLNLYKFTATSGVISNVNKVIEAIGYLSSTYVKNSIFSSDNPSSFGNYTVGKKKILWQNASGQQNPSSITLSETIQSGDTINIKLAFSNYAAEDYRICFNGKTGFISKNYITQYTNFMVTTDSVAVNYASGKITFSTRSEYIYDAINKTATFTTNSLSIYVYEISKIIE